MANFFLQNTTEFSSHFDYQHEVNQWTAEGAATRALYTTDVEHPSCMEISSGVDGAGVYYTMACQAGTKYVVEFAYKNTSSQELDIVIYDVTNTANIATATLTETVWSNYYTEITTPATCVSLRLYLRAGTASGPIEEIYIDDVVMQGNAMVREPDTYTPSYPKYKREHQTIARKVIDLIYTGYRATMAWDFLPDAYFQQLLDVYTKGEGTYFDDGNVRQMVDEGYIYLETTYTFSGITNPSGTHLAYYSSSQSIPAASTDFQSTEFSTADYTAIGADDASATDRESSGNKYYQYEKYMFNVTEYSNIEEIKSISIKWIGTCADNTTNAANGVTMYLWNGTTWFRVAQTRSADEQTITFSVSKPEQAQDFVDLAGGYIRILIRSNGYGASVGSITLDSDYVECIINDGLGEIIDLTNKAILTAGDVVSVENITQGTTLVLGAGYIISDNRQRIITIGQTAGDLIRVTYNQYYFVELSDLSDPRLPIGTLSTPNRRVNLSIESLVKLD